MATSVAVALAGGAWVLVSTGATGAGSVQSEPLTVQTLRVDVLRDLPHDTTAYTQGLLWRDGWLYESTGQYGDSRLRRIDPKTGLVDQQVYTAPRSSGRAWRQSTINWSC